MEARTTENGTLSRRERERLRRRSDILQAACEVFAEKGYTQATLDEVAQRAEFGKGTLYNYFGGGKEAILFAVFDKIYGEMYDHVDAAFAREQMEGRPFRAVFRDFAETMFRFFLDRRDLFVILIREAQRLSFSDDQDKACYFIEHRERLAHLLAEPLEARMAAGEIRPLDPAAVAHMIFGNISGMQLHLCLESCADEPLLQPTQAADFLTAMLCDGLSLTPSDAPNSPNT